MRYNNKNVILPEPYVQPGPANNEIWYTSTDGNIVTPNNTSSLPSIVSNTYVDGKGIIKCASDITIIGENAFWGRNSLTSVTIGNSVTSIGSGAFSNCSSLSYVTIPDTVNSIEGFAFYGCAFTSVTIPDTVNNIGKWSFGNCKSLTSISYEGTISQWNAITKGNYWKDNVPATVVHCTDGDAPI